MPILNFLFGSKSGYFNFENYYFKYEKFYLNRKFDIWLLKFGNKCYNKWDNNKSNNDKKN
jgi:hypothetical protein